jgi:FixJ family two-component response regulator
LTGGAIAFLHKPVDAEVLLDAVKSGLALAH